MSEAVKNDPTRKRWIVYQDDSRTMVWSLSKREDEAEDGNEAETNVSTARRRRTRTSNERNWNGMREKNAYGARLSSQSRG